MPGSSEQPPTPLPRPEVRAAFSALQRERLATPPDVPDVLREPRRVKVVAKEALGAVDDHDKIEALFPKTYGRPRVELAVASNDAAAPEEGNNGTSPRGPQGPLRVGVVLSGGQASGGHNVIAGIYDYVKGVSPDSVLIGFANGPKGVFTGKFLEVDPAMMDCYRNTGGFDMLGSGRDKIEKPEEFKGALAVVSALELDGLVVIGGDDSNTNAAVLAEYFEANGCKTRVIGAPKTIDGDLKTEHIPVSFGFDTACKTYSELIGNVMLDCLSSQKYYHMVRLMGRSASHIALECALQTRPNACLISEEVQAKHQSLSDITHQLVNMIVARAREGKHYGVILLPEGLIEAVPEFQALIAELNELAAQGLHSEEQVMAELSFNNRAVFSYLPSNIKEQLLLDRDPHGNVQVAKVETEKLIAGTVEQELEKLRHHGSYAGAFKPQFHAFGYEGRAGLPSLFDANYCYALGLTAGHLIGQGLTSLMVSIRGVCGPIEEWQCGGIPLTMMMCMERRKGKDKPVIRKALVELEGKPFQMLQRRREGWQLNDCYRAPGPIQYAGVYAQEVNLTLQYECLPESEVRDSPDVARPATKMGSHLFTPAPLAGLAPAQQERLKYTPRLPPSLLGGSTLTVKVIEGEATQCVFARDRALMRREFPHSYGLPMVHLQDSHYTPALAGKQNNNNPVIEVVVKDPLSASLNNSGFNNPGALDGDNFAMKDMQRALAAHSISSTSEPHDSFNPYGSCPSPTITRAASLSLGKERVERVASAGRAVRVGVAFCGRQFPGGHNVLAGLHDFLSHSQSSSSSTVLGFVGGLQGVYEQQAVPLTDELLATYRGQGGLDLLGRSHESLPETKEGMEKVKAACLALELDGLVLLGGCRTATGAAYLTEFLQAEGVETAVCVVPCGIDNTLSSQFVESTVGFHTACQVYAQLIGNTAIDGASAKKYTTFVRLMGSDVSHIALEAALKSAPNMVLLAEDVDASRKSLRDVVRDIADLVTERARRGRNYATILVPEGILLAIPDVRVLIHEIDAVFRESSKAELSVEEVAAQLSTWSAALLRSMPAYIQVQMTKERQSDSRAQLSAIESERLLAHFVEQELARRKGLGTFKGSFNAICSFLGYQARGSLPSNFDADLAYAMGGAAATLVHNNLTGYLASITGLKGPSHTWKVAGVPLTALLALEDSVPGGAGSEDMYGGMPLRPRVPVRKVDLSGAAYKTLLEKRRAWGLHDLYENAGPLQFHGKTADARPATLVEEDKDYLAELEVLHAALHKVKRACRPGCSSALLHMATKSILTLTDVVSMMDEQQV